MPPRARQSRGSADTIRILVATDSHVGYNERDAIRGDDSWKTFHEVMCLAKEHDVDMVLHAGDLFHENKPSRKSMYQVMRSLRMNCLGDKPCELEMLSDASENFQGIFDHVNYEDPDINVAIPVFAIHGNHDDPSGEGHLAALDLLQVCGLVNYYGRTPESDNIQVKPVLLQKGHTKLALYGLSNVRDERLFRTFRDGKVKFFRPGAQQDEWFNLMSVHQNHHAYTETGYLPENFLPEFIDMVIWGHEHECQIDPRRNPEMGFDVIQPGSSVATSLMPGEAVAKHVTILSITGKDVVPQAIRLKTVRPFVMKEIVLAEERAVKEKELWRVNDNRLKITAHLTRIVENLIEQAQKEWLELQDENEADEERTIPLPLVRLRVEYSTPNGEGKFDCENPQRFSNRFVDKVANVNDVVQFYRKKKEITRTLKNNAELPEESILAQLSLDTVKVDQLVKEFLEAQSLTILPQNSFGDAVAQFVDKDDRQAVEVFVNESLSNQLKYLLSTNEMDEADIHAAMDSYKSKLEELFASGQLRRSKRRKLRPKPVNWDSDMDGDWADQPAAVIHSDDDQDQVDSNVASTSATQTTGRGRGRGRGGRAAASTTTRKPAAAPKKPAPARGGRGRKKVVEEEEEDDGDVIMLDDDDEEEEELFVRPRATARKPAATSRAAPKAKSPPARKTTTRAPTRQATLNFSSQASTQRGTAASRGKNTQTISDDEISDDDDDAFEPVSSSRTLRNRR